MPREKRKKGELTACIVGHSFVRRLGENIARSTQYRKADYDLARAAAASLRLDATYSAIHVYGKAGFLVNQIRKDIFKAGKSHPDVVVINCGSNDLCDKECDELATANALVSYARLLKISYGTKYVAILSIVRRSRCRKVSADVFWDRAYSVNGHLKHLTKSLEGIEFVPMSGFSKTPDGASDLPVADWSGDGIHPDLEDPDDESLDKYKRNIRSCLLTGAGKCLSSK